MRGRELKLMLCDSREDSLPDQTESTQLGLFGETRRDYFILRMRFFLCRVSCFLRQPFNVPYLKEQTGMYLLTEENMTEIL